MDVWKDPEINSRFLLDPDLASGLMDVPSFFFLPLIFILENSFGVTIILPPDEDRISPDFPISLSKE